MPQAEGEIKQAARAIAGPLRQEGADAWCEAKEIDPEELHREAELFLVAAGLPPTAIVADALMAMFSIGFTVAERRGMGG